MFPKWWCEPGWKKLFLLILYIIQWLLLTAHLALLKEMNRSGVGKKKGIWMVFLCQFIFTTFKSYPLIFCCKNIGREIRGWSQETAKIERKRTDQEGSGVKIDKGICEGYYLLGVGQSESQLGYQETPPRPAPLATFSEPMAFSQLRGEASCVNYPKCYWNISPGRFWNMSLFDKSNNYDNDKYPLWDTERW